jgi:short-chain fatty acids transporter
MDGLRFKASAFRLFDAYYRGLWMLLPFTMQMTLILVLSLVLAATPTFRKVIVGISRLPRNRTEVVIVAVLFTAAISYLNWGLSVTLSPVIAIYVCKEAERRGIGIDFMYMMALLAGAGSVWQFGLSASGPLLMASNNHFLTGEGIGVWPLATTIFTPAALTMTFVFTLACIVAGIVFMPRRIRPLSTFPDSDRLTESHVSAQVTNSEVDAAGDVSLAQRLERSHWTLAPMHAALIVWLYFHFFVNGLALEINSLITIYLLVCFLLHRNILRFTAALQEAIISSWPIVIMYHLYAGVAGLIQYTSVGEYISSLVAQFSTAYTFPLLTAMISSVVAVFLPSSGTQWAIQGLITVKTALATGLSGQHGLLALGVGDQMGNLIAPFWAVVGAGIARVDFRQFFGYRLIFAAIWFVLGVLIFTFIPT